MKVTTVVVVSVAPGNALGVRHRDRTQELRVVLAWLTAMPRMTASAWTSGGSPPGLLDDRRPAQRKPEQFNDRRSAASGVVGPEA
jgi:hypothetical protein